MGAVYRRAPGRAWGASPISFYELLPEAPQRGTGGKRTLLTWRNYHSTDLVLAGCP